MLDQQRSCARTDAITGSAGRLTNDFEQRFLEALPIIDDVVASLSRGSRLPDDDMENFRSVVLVKLIEDDYRVFRLFRGQCSIRTYLRVVARRILLDCRSHHWGKWRSSIVAKRQGGVAVRLEQLVSRDRLTFREAVATLRTNFGVDESTTALRDIASQLPTRQRVRVECAEELPEVKDDAPLPDAMLSGKQNRTQAVRVRRELIAALRTLSSRDRQILRMRFFQAMPVVEIAQALSYDAKALYVRIDRILKAVRSELQRKGVDNAPVTDCCAQ